MRREYHFWVYMLASRSRNLYVGMTNNLSARVRMHREGTGSAHAERYNVHRLVYFEYHRYVRNAIGRENALKRFSRAEKIALIEKVNPTWEDLLPAGAEFALQRMGAEAATSQQVLRTENDN